MDTYLLLRSNKQSGPYSLQQLVSFGLKPYDLVWVEGRSAAWRYPSEVDGLKAYAPATEEQPYDRFYKKTEQKPQEKQIDKPALPEQQTYELPKEETYALPVENKTVTPSRKVFVAMPENHLPKKQAQPVSVKTPPIVEEKPIEVKKVETKPLFTEQLYTEHKMPPKEPLSQKEEPVIKTYPVSLKEEPTLNEKYSESLDDIKRRYTETYLSRKKRSKWTRTHTSVLQVFGGAIVFCLIVVLIYKNFAGEDKTQSRTTMIQPDKRSINTVIPSNTSNVAPPMPEAKTSPVKKTQARKEDGNVPAESLVTNSVQQQNDDAVKDEMAAIEKVEKKEVMPKTSEQKPEETKPKTRPVNINRLVNVQANNYKQRAFGGVMNLELTVNNDSKFELDKVIVELQYLKPSEQPIKTEKIVFNGIEPNGSKTLRIPDYLRGVKVAYRVMEIESSQYDRQTTAGL